MADTAHAQPSGSTLTDKLYRRAMHRLQVELVKLQEWVRASRTRVAVVFEGRDGAGKGGTISRITQYLNPRVVRVAALPAPSDRERSQWYFQRYVAHLPAAGEAASSTAPGTTAPASSTLWGSAPRTSTGSSCASAPSSSSC